MAKKTNNSAAAKTVPKLSEDTGISERQLHRYFDRGCPRTSARAVLEWKTKNIRDRSATSADANPEAGTIQEARLELVKQQTLREAEVAERYSIENAQRRGELIEKVEVTRDISIAVSRLKNRLNRLGVDIAVLVPAEMKATTKQRVEDTVNTALRELANALQEEATDDE